MQFHLICRGKYNLPQEKPRSLGHGGGGQNESGIAFRETLQEREEWKECHYHWRLGSTEQSNLGQDWGVSLGGMTSLAIACLTNPGLLSFWCLCNSLANLIHRGFNSWVPRTRTLWGEVDTSYSWVSCYPRLHPSSASLGIVHWRGS